MSDFSNQDQRDYKPKYGVDVHLKLWQLIATTVGIISIFLTGWISINMQVKELQVNQQNHLKQIDLNTKKIELIYEKSVENQQEIMREIFDLKIILKDKENRPD